MADMDKTITIQHTYVKSEEAILMGKDTPWRRRENVVMLCKAIIRYMEGPGEIDSLVHETCDHLGNLVNVMKSAHHHALEEQAAAQEKVVQRKDAMKDIPKHLMRQAVLEYFRENPEELPTEFELADLEMTING